MENFALEDAIDILRRRWPLVAVPTILGALVGGAVAVVLPPVYESTARILVESQQIPSDLARSTVASSAAESIQLVEQRLMTRNILLEIARRYDVFAGEPDLAPTEIEDRMRAAVTFETTGLTAGGRSAATLAAFSVTFKADDATTAARVTNEFLTRILEQNARQRSERASETKAFFTGEVARLTREMQAAEDRVAQFKQANADALPETLGFRRAEATSLGSRLLNVETEIATLTERRRQIEQALASGQISATIGAQLSPEQAELLRLEREIVQQRAVYAESHPAMQALQARARALREAVAPLSASPETDGASPTPAGLAAIELDQIERRRGQLEELRDTLSARLSALEAAIARTPQVEIDLNSLQLDFANIRTRQQDAVLKEAAADTGERLEINRQAERFEVIEQPQTPNAPVSPKRPVIAAAGVVGGGALGAGLVVLLELLNKAIRTPRDLERRVDLRPVVTIPYIYTRGERLWRTWLRRAPWIALGLAIPATLWAIDQFYAPLTLIWERALNMTGLDRLVGAARARLGF